MGQRWSSDFDVQIVSAKIRSYEIKLLSVLEYLEGDMVSSVTYTLYKQQAFIRYGRPGPAGYKRSSK